MACLFFLSVENMSMRKLVFVVIVLLVVVLMVFNSSTPEEYDYLRLHIRANSNLAVDQNVKYEIRSELVRFLTPYFEGSASKRESIDCVNRLTSRIEYLCDDILKSNNLSYRSKVKINNEYFPTRTYGNTTLESGYYDAVIIELGEAQGDNWWCVMYPPLCFVNNFDQTMHINFKSKISEWWRMLFSY